MTDEEMRLLISDATDEYTCRSLPGRLATALEQSLAERDQAVTAWKEFRDSVVVAADLGYISNTGTIPRKIAELKARAARMEAALRLISNQYDHEWHGDRGGLESNCRACIAIDALAEEAKPTQTRVAKEAGESPGVLAFTLGQFERGR